MGGYHPRSLSGKASTPAYPGNNQGLQIAARKGRLFLSQSRRDLLLVSRESGESNPTPDCSTTRVRPPWLFVSNPVLFFYCAFYYFLIFHSSSHTFFSFSGVALAGLVLSPLSFHPRHCRSWRFLSFNHWPSGLCAFLLFYFLSFRYCPPLFHTTDVKVYRFSFNSTSSLFDLAAP